MREMKDSGIEWVGAIPKDWEMIKMKYLFKIIGSGGTPKTSDREYYDGEHNWLQTGDLNDGEVLSTSKTITQKAVEECSTLVKYKKGSLVIALYGATIGKLGILGIDTYTNQACCVMQEPIKTNMKFVYYWLLCNRENIINMSLGGGQPNISQGMINSLKICVPKPLSEQQQIAIYLDKKCAEIDAVIKGKEDENKALEEYRKSVIYEAVTKGLNPDAEMKDSGIEWIGDIPKDWEIKKIKHLFSVLSGATPKSNDNVYWDGDIVWITPADYKTEDVFISKGRRSITEFGLKSCATRMVPINSIIFSKRAPVGAVAISAKELCTNQGCLSCIPFENVVTKFYYYILSILQSEFEEVAEGTTFKEISYDSFVNFKLPFVVQDAQQQIAEYLDKKCEEIDNLINSNQDIIDKLKEYKKSLIFEAVTGKIEIG